MRWNGAVAFVRPIRWIVALYNLKVVPCSFAQVSSGNRSFGHRLLAPEPFKAADFASYQKEIRKRFVLIDPSERYQKIKKEIAQIAQKISGIVEEDDPLLWQAAYSTEYPEAICGSFDRASLFIPKEIISAVMKEHQGYFPVIGTPTAVIPPPMVAVRKSLDTVTTPADGAPSILPYFIAVLNNKDKKKMIQKGCERVLKARLSDARFYFEEDCKARLDDRIPALKGVLFQEKLGTLYDKTQRLVLLSKFIAQKIESLTILSPARHSILEEVKRVAPLCKADLVTGIVREFPSLQGVMGQILAERDSEKETASINGQAIQEHYQPRFPGDALPKSLSGQIVSIADKLDTIVGCFGIGKVPTGSEDPYALRRQGVGLIQILSINSLFRPFLLPDLIQESVRYYEHQKIVFKTNPTLEVVAFLKGRIASLMQLKSIRHDIIDAVLTHKTLIPLPPYDMLALAEALSHFSEKSLFNPLMTCYKRAARILVSGFNVKVNPSLFTGRAESVLWSFILKAVKEVDVHYEKPDFSLILEALATLYTPLNQFFTDILVMDKNEEIRKNRMALLRVVVNLFDRFGDFSKIQEAMKEN
jgi:glycyl-tRNA synthetase beta chain